MFLRQIFDPYLAQYAYLVGCPRTGEALLIDPERDVDRYHRVARENGLKITAVAETHIHADFVSGAQELAAADPALRVYLSAEVGPEWSYRWPRDRKNVHWLGHGERFEVGKLRVEAVHTPGHTPEHMSYLITDWGGGAGEPIALVTGDFLFVGDVGRPDLLESAAGVQGVMEPSARELQHSLRERLGGLSEYLQILPGHGAGSACGKALGAVPTSTLGYERRYNAPLRSALAEGAGFVREILSGQPEPPLYFARMKQVNRDGIVVTGRLPQPPHLEPGAFAARAQAGARVLDTRADSAAFGAAHLPGALFAPLRTALFSVAVGSYVDAEEALLLVVEREADVELAVRQLYRIGYDHPEGWLTVEEARAGGLFTARLERVEFAVFDPAEALAQGEIVDVRTSQEFAEGHVAGARSFPYTRLKTRLAELPRGRVLSIHCGSGARAAVAAAFLQGAGFAVVHVDGVCATCEVIARKHGVLH